MKMPVAASATGNEIGELRPLGLTTTAVAVPGATSYGTCALICPVETASRGTDMPFTSTDTSAVAGARSLPKIEMRAPGATGAVKLAAFTMPPGEIEGAAILRIT